MARHARAIHGASMTDYCPTFAPTTMTAAASLDQPHRLSHRSVESDNGVERKRGSLTERTSRKPIVATPIFDREVMELVGIPSTDGSLVVAVNFSRRYEYRYPFVAKGGNG